MKKIIIILIISLVALDIFAQGPPPAPTEEEIPIAGNLLFLLISGITYGINKFYHFRKQMFVKSKEKSI